MSGDRPRVAMVAYTQYETDPRVRREAEALTRAGFAVDFLALRRAGQAGHEEIGGVDLFRLPQERYRGENGARYAAAYVRFLLRAGWWLFRQTRRRRIRLIHVNTMPDFMVFAALWPRAVWRVPVILDIHDSMPEIFAEKFGVSPRHWKIRLLRVQERWSARLATRVLTVHEPIRGLLAEHGVPREKIDILLNLPDEAVFGSPEGPLPEEDAACFRLVHHGTLAHRLGLDVALRALAAIRAEMDALGPWRLDVFGEGDARSALVALCRELGLGDRVVFSEGFVPLTALPARLRGAGLGLATLRLQSDTRWMLPTKLLEYAHLGIAALARATPTIRHHFGEGLMTLIESDDPMAWGDAILTLRRDSARRRAQAARAREFARAHRWETHQRIYVELVQRLTGLRP